MIHWEYSKVGAYKNRRWTKATCAHVSQWQFYGRMGLVHSYAEFLVKCILAASSLLLEQSGISSYTLSGSLVGSTQTTEGGREGGRERGWIVSLTFIGRESVQDTVHKMFCTYLLNVFVWLSNKLQRLSRPPRQDKTWLLPQRSQSL